jgi:Signal peptide peptidase
MNSPSVSTNPGIILSYFLILSLWLSSQWILIPYVVHILVLVTTILYVACHSSLILLEEPSEEDKANGIVSNSSTETLRTEDAYQFPLVGSVSLGSLYLAFKYLDKEWVNFIIGFYFVAVGCFAVYATASSIVPRFGTPRKFQRTIRHPIPTFLLESPIQLDISITISDVCLFLASMVLCGFYAYTKHWTMNNILGICFCLQGIERFSLGTYKIGAILLIGLFFYDIFWV